MCFYLSFFNFLEKKIITFFIKNAYLSSLNSLKKGLLMLKIEANK